MSTRILNNAIANPLAAFDAAAANMSIATSSLIGAGASGAGVTRPWYVTSVWTNDASKTLAAASTPVSSSAVNNGGRTFPFSSDAAAGLARHALSRLDNGNSALTIVTFPEALPPFARVALKFTFPFFGLRIRTVYISPAGAVHMSPQPPCCSGTVVR
jgi:hypothetical protein